MGLKRVASVLFGLWLLRWAAGEVAAYAGRHWREHGPPPLESPRAPGWMPPPNEGWAGAPSDADTQRE